MINYILPGFYCHFNLNKKLLKLFKINPEWFINDIVFSSCYDSFPYDLFEGGRNLLLFQQTNQEKILEILNLFNNEYNIPLRLVCTNSIIQSNQFTNTFSNIVLKLCENNFNEILIGNNLELENYIRTYYPKYKFISSTTKNILSLENLLIELQKYDQVCLNYNFNNQFNILNQIPKNLRFKCEFLCNEICPPNCYQREQHYKEISKSILEYRREKFYCPTYNIIKNQTIKNHHITLENISQNYLPLFFNNFKLQGRQLNDNQLISLYSKYLIKEKYNKYFISEIKMTS